MLEDTWTTVGVLLLLCEVLGALSAIQAILTARTSQGAIAWALALVTWPFLAVPLYWIFGRNKFRGYAMARRERDIHLLGIVDDVLPRLAEYVVELPAELREAHVLEELAHLPYSRRNGARLLVNGAATFEAIFAAIDDARDYVLAEFFIVRDDCVGRELKERLVRKAREGLHVYLLYDEVGSRKLPRKYLADLKSAGVHTSGIRTARGVLDRFQLNFRNHRKVVVVDGRVAFVGGHNVGDEYLGRHPRLTPWRDTHVRIEGPAVLSVQLAFAEDWHWATQTVPDVTWMPRPAGEDDKVLFVFPSGPADEYETCGLLFTHAINCARRRLWIASPYFVPDEAIINALSLAAMRGVDVRVLIPGVADKWFTKLAAESFVEQAIGAGVKVFEYGRGFMHQKVVLIDHDVSIVGTANFDNRSFRLNFEISVIVMDPKFGRETEEMLEADFADSTAITTAQTAGRSLVRRVGSRFARLFSPIL